MILKMRMRGNARRTACKTELSAELDLTDKKEAVPSREGTAFFRLIAGR